MVASIGVVAAPSQGAGYYERDGYYARDDPAHREASAWAGRGAESLGLSGPVDPDLFKAVLEGKAPDGSGRQLGRRDPMGPCSTGPDAISRFPPPNPSPSPRWSAATGVSPRPMTGPSNAPSPGSRGTSPRPA